MLSSGKTHYVIISFFLSFLKDNGNTLAATEGIIKPEIITVSDDKKHDDFRCIAFTLFHDPNGDTVFKAATEGSDL